MQDSYYKLQQFSFPTIPIHNIVKSYVTGQWDMYWYKEYSTSVYGHIWNGFTVWNRFLIAP